MCRLQAIAHLCRPQRTSSASNARGQQHLLLHVHCCCSHASSSVGLLVAGARTRSSKPAYQSHQHQHSGHLAICHRTIVSCEPPSCRQMHAYTTHRADGLCQTMHRMIAEAQAKPQRRGCSRKNAEAVGVRTSWARSDGGRPPAASGRRTAGCPSPPSLLPRPHLHSATLQLSLAGFIDVRYLGS